MRVLKYSDLDTAKVTKQVNKVIQMLEAEDFSSAEVKKLNPTPYYRAKLDYTNRLLFKFSQYKDQTYILL